MDYDVLKMKTFDWKWLNLHFVHRVDKKRPFSTLNKGKEIEIWYKPYKTVNFDVKRSSKTWDKHLDRCYNIGLRLNRSKFWIRIKFKTGK